MFPSYSLGSIQCFGRVVLEVWSGDQQHQQSPGNLIEMEILGLYPKLDESKHQTVGPTNLYLNRVCRQFWEPLSTAHSSESSTQKNMVDLLCVVIFCLFLSWAMSFLWLAWHGDHMYIASTKGKENNSHSLYMIYTLTDLFVTWDRNSNTNLLKVKVFTH